MRRFEEKSPRSTLEARLDWPNHGTRWLAVVLEVGILGLDTLNQRRKIHNALKIPSMGNPQTLLKREFFHRSSRPSEEKRGYCRLQGGDDPWKQPRVGSHGPIP